MSARLAAALDWAAQGWPVLPCCPDGERAKSPLIEGGKNSATTDPAQIRAWWAEFPDALIGGRTDGRIVLDFDAYKAGHADDLAELGDLPPTRTHRTPGKQGTRGRHLVYLDPEGECRSTKLGPHGTIDVRAGTSRDYVILPGPGDGYEVTDGQAPAPCPPWLREAARVHGRATERASDGLPALEALPPGTNVSALTATGTDDPSVHTFRLIRNAKGAGLTPGQARTLSEDDEMTQERISHPRHGQPRWWPDEFWRCWSTCRPRVGPASHESPPRRTPVHKPRHLPPGQRPHELILAEKAYEKHLPSADLVPTRAVWAAYVANQVLDGDPVWMMLVGGSGVGKTERLMPVAQMAGVTLMSAVTGEAAFLSAASKKDRDGASTGGALRQVGERGVLLLKDFTTILSMNRDKRAEVLAALREIYDGRWDRHYGADGGQVVTWQGKCGLLAGCTTAIDSHGAVVAEMGPRSLFVRPLEADPDEIGASALGRTGQETAMRQELTQVVGDLLTALPGDPHAITAEVAGALVSAASLASQARSPVSRDYKHQVIQVDDAEAPTRVVKQLGQIWRACGLIGLDRDESWAVVRRAAVDSIPKLRRSVVSKLGLASEPMTKGEVAARVKYETSSARSAVGYALEDLQLHGVVVSLITRSRGVDQVEKYALSPRARGWYDHIRQAPRPDSGG